MQITTIKSRVLKNIAPVLIILSIVLILISFVGTTSIYNQSIDNLRHNFDSESETAVQMLVTSLEEIQRLRGAGILNDATAERVSKDVVRSTRYGSTKEGYFWADTADGKCAVHPNPEYEGLMRWDYKDLNGFLYIQNFIRLGDEGGGFSEFYFTKLNRPENQKYKKRGYTEKFEPYGWYISTGNYYEEIDTVINAYKFKEFETNIALVVAGIVISLIGVKMLARQVAAVSEPITKLTCEVVRTSENFESADTELAVARILKAARTGDELETLANSFAQMNTRLKDYVLNLQDMTVEKERIGAELDVATRIQSSMLPCIFPAFPERKEFDIYATMKPAKSVGGDFYDYIIVNDNTLCFLVADVSGKGVPAALFMVIAKTLIKNNVQHGLGPAEIFNTVNNLLYENNRERMFVTCFMAFMNTQTGEITAVNAGHNPPVICRRDGTCEFVSMKARFVLAGMRNIRYTEEQFTLEPGDMLYLYTDGVTEATNVNNAFFTDERLLRAVRQYRKLPVSEFVQSIFNEVENFAGETEQADDITMLAIRRSTSSVMPQSASAVMPPRPTDI